MALSEDRSAAPTGPRFMLAHDQFGSSGLDGGRLVVMEVATGQVTQEVTRPPGVLMFEGLTSAADNRTFYFDGTTEAGGAGRLFRVRIDDQGRVAAMAPVPGITPYGGDLALSPDGTRLAYADPRLGQIVVTDLTNGRHQGWLRMDFAAADGMSWSADGRKLAFTWETGDDSSPDDGVRVLDTAHTGDPLALSRLVIPAEPYDPGRSLVHAVISADGTAVQAVMTTGEETRVSEFSVATGSHVRDLHRATGRPMTVCRTPAGRHLLIVGKRTVTVLDTLTGGTVEHRYLISVSLTEAAC
ncbi:WD40 repeat domain-containing protein [Actinomadura sp. 9N407]|uniref:WD40 repeat domain-containing protein n=1 Tax=Actinomadura sp. 9N407 TaxID=3375154 RepID=UPI00379512B7